MFARLMWGVKWENRSWNLHETTARSKQHFVKWNWLTNLKCRCVQHSMSTNCQRYGTQMRHIKLEMFTFIIRLLHLWGGFVCFRYLFSYLYKNEETYFTSFPLGLIIIYFLRFSGHQSMELFAVCLLDSLQFSHIFQLAHIATSPHQHVPPEMIAQFHSSRNFIRQRIVRCWFQAIPI